MYLYKFQDVFLSMENVFAIIAKCKRPALLNLIQIVIAQLQQEAEQTRPSYFWDGDYKGGSRRRQMLPWRVAFDSLWIFDFDATLDKYILRFVLHQSLYIANIVPMQLKQLMKLYCRNYMLHSSISSSSSSSSRVGWSFTNTKCAPLWVGWVATTTKNLGSLSEETNSYSPPDGGSWVIYSSVICINVHRQQNHN